jgi:drug/metabolite transporter (DMT)-like permease
LAALYRGGTIIPFATRNAMTTGPNPTERRRAARMLVLASLYWGLSFPVIKAITLLNRSLFPSAGTWFLASLATAPRFLLAVALMLVLRRGERLPTPSEVRQGVVVGAFAALGTLFQTDGLQFTLASTSSFLTQLCAILVPTWIALRHRRNPGAIVWMCCTLVLVGVAVLGRFDWHTFRFGRGETETLLCSVFFTGQILWVGRKEFAGNRPGTVTLIMFAVQAATFAGMAAVTAPDAGALLIPWRSPPWMVLTLVLTLVCTVGAFSLMTRWQPRITSTEAGLIYCTEPLFASVFVLFLPALISHWVGLDYSDERATWSLAVGGGLITFANVWVQLKTSTLLEAVEGKHAV